MSASVALVLLIFPVGELSFSPLLGGGGGGLWFTVHLTGESYGEAFTNGEVPFEASVLSGRAARASEEPGRSPDAWRYPAVVGVLSSVARL